MCLTIPLNYNLELTENCYFNKKIQPYYVHWIASYRRCADQNSRGSELWL